MLLLVGSGSDSILLHTSRTVAAHPTSGTEGSISISTAIVSVQTRSSELRERQEPHRSGDMRHSDGRAPLYVARRAHGPSAVPCTPSRHLFFLSSGPVRSVTTIRW